jgi:gamma-glutamyltranspeptidase/glutathione hydrolase
MAMAHKKFGRLAWKDVVMPASSLAARGFAMPPSLVRSLNAEVSGRMKEFPASVAAYSKPGGGAWADGDRLGSSGSLEEPRRDRGERGRVLHRLDCRSHC